MKLAASPAARLDQVQTWIRRCEVSRTDRESRMKQIRRYMLYGSDGGSPARYNMLNHAFRLKASYLYSQRSLRFTVNAPEGADAETAERCEIASNEVSKAWHESDASRLFAWATLWGLAYGTMLLKFGWNGGLRVWTLEPAMFGVLREQSPRLTDQEAMCFKYWVPKSEIARALAAAGKSEDEIAKLMATFSILPGAESDDDAKDWTFPVITSQVTPTILGSVTGIGATVNTVGFEPRSDEPLVEMRELVVYDDATRDYHIFTVAMPGYILFDRPLKDLFIPKELPFVAVTPVPLPDYFWGYSEAWPLLNLQDWREKRMTQLDKLFERQVRPPAFGVGLTGITDEKYAAAFRQGGMISSQMPNAKFEALWPQLPPESFAEINAIDSMFYQSLGLAEILKAKGTEVGPGQVGPLTALASAPIIQTILELEASLEKCGELTLKLMQQEDDTLYETEQGSQFSLAMLPAEVSVTVAAHSASPLFADMLRQEATQMLEAQVIDPEAYIELTDPPQKQYLLDRLKARQKAEQSERQQEIQMFAQALQETPAPQRASILESFLTSFSARRKK